MHLRSKSDHSSGRSWTVGTHTFIIRAMPKNRVARIASAAAVASLLLVATAPAADAPTLAGTLKASISPNKAETPPKNGLGTPLNLNLDVKFKQPEGTTFVLKSLTYQLPKGAVANGKIFPSCSAAKL